MENPSLVISNLEILTQTPESSLATLQLNLSSITPPPTESTNSNTNTPNYVQAKKDTSPRTPISSPFTPSKRPNLQSLTARLTSRSRATGFASTSSNSINSSRETLPIGLRLFI